MKIEILEKANNLLNDIKRMSRIIDDKEKERKWISVISSGHKEDGYFTDRFEDELVEWLKVKREEYQKEFDSLN